MNKCIDKHYKYTGNPIPIKINDRLYIACVLESLLSNDEIVNLCEYVNKLLAQIDDKRRKKYVQVTNKKAAKLFCKRWRLPSYKINGTNYVFKEYLPDIEIIQWQKNKALSNISFNKITSNKYLCENMIHYVITLDNISSRTTLQTNDGAEKEIILMDIRSLAWNSSMITLQESLSAENNTQIYFHALYEIN